MFRKRREMFARWQLLSLWSRWWWPPSQTPPSTASSRWKFAKHVFEILVVRSCEYMHQAPRNGPFQTQNYIDIEKNFPGLVLPKTKIWVIKKNWNYSSALNPDHDILAFLSSPYFIKDAACQIVISLCQIICRYSFTRKPKIKRKNFDTGNSWNFMFWN